VAWVCWSATYSALSNSLDIQLHQVFGSGLELAGYSTINSAYETAYSRVGESIDGGRGPQLHVSR
jgi:hypothetical protein